MIIFQVSETIASHVDEAFKDGKLFEKSAAAALEASSDVTEGDLTILLTGDAEIQELNRTYLEIDEPTDVLSFPADYTDPDTGSPYLGDVIISYPRAEEQASSAGHSLEHELQLLVVHGVLHLSSYDHLEEEDKQEMWSVQAKVLQQLGNPLSPP
jgi:probable rRNA maturation factor